ncbi:MAG: diacylglycerol kinase [Spirochaetaceae bacterium]|nr:diacylglycerol kinase [Spirochaetaceae bacterium]
MNVDFGQLFEKLLLHSLVAHQKGDVSPPLRYIILANPCAGGWTIPKRRAANLKALEEAAAFAEKNNPRRDAAVVSIPALDEADALCENGVLNTKKPGVSYRLTQRLLDIIKVDDSSVFYLIICAGGDGTSLEVQSAIYDAAEHLLPARILDRLAVLRLPFGTGNDGADGFTLDTALRLLTHPSYIEKNPALILRTAKETTVSGAKGPFTAFNILSVGLDAFVTHMTNKMKGKLPGDSYKLWVDVASLLYDKIYHVGYLDIKAFKDNSTEPFQTLHEKALLLAMGASGRRCYGSQNWILPDARNVCIVKQMPLLKKVKLKGQFKEGTHSNLPISILFNCDRVEFMGDNPILAQMDGETVLLQKDDFPASISLSEKIIPVLHTT